jgi:hypothetical protein
MLPNLHTMLCREALVSNDLPRHMNPHHLTNVSGLVQCAARQILEYERPRLIPGKFRGVTSTQVRTRGHQEKQYVLPCESRR